MNSEQSAIEIDGLNHRFISPKGESVSTLEDVSLKVAPGEFVAIVGPSGCGKSTILNILSGLLRATEGRVEINGDSVKGVREDLVYMPARDSLFPWRTCRKNVEFPLEMQGSLSSEERSERANSLLNSVGLKGFADYFPSSLSHGMRQRVAVARTFSTSPRVLLMDEPFSALDAQTKIVVQDLFLDIWEQAKQTVLLITHDVMEAVALADRVVVLSARPGRIKSVHNIDLPRPRSVRKLLFDEPKFQKYLHAIWKDLDVQE